MTKSFVPPSNIEQLLEGMLDHRQRVVLQVAGVPVQALAAVGMESQNFLGTTFERGTPTETRPGKNALAGMMRQWMDERAKRSFLFKTLYEDFTSWGRENKEIEAQVWEENDKRREKLNDAQTLERKLALGAVSWTENDRHVLNKIDREVIDNLVARNYFNKTPHIFNRDVDIFAGSPLAVPVYGAAGSVFMNSDKLGNYPSAFPTNSQGQAELAHEWANSGGPSTQAHVESIYHRWFILFHEVAHCMYGAPPQPFNPTPGLIDEETVELMNRWIVGGLGTAGADAKILLNENHSDVYAVMLLMEVTGHDPRAVAVVDRVIRERANDQKTTDEEIMGDADMELLGRPSRDGSLPDNHCTQWALMRAMDEVERWKGSTPDQLKKHAIRYASDGLLDFAHPNRLYNGRSVGKVALERIMPDEIDSKGMSRLLMWLGYSYSCNGNPQGWIDTQDKTNPVHELVSKSWQQLKGPLQKLMAEKVPVPGSHTLAEKENDVAHSFGKKDWSGMTVADGIRANAPEFMDKMAELINSLPLPAITAEHADFKAASKASCQAGEKILRSLTLQLLHSVPYEVVKGSRIDTQCFGAADTAVASTIKVGGP